MEKIREQFSCLQIAKRCASKEDSTYFLDIDISREEGNHLVAVSCSNQSVRVYNRETLMLLREYSSHQGMLYGVRFARTGEGTLFSACSDGSVKCWDTRSASVEPVQRFCGYPSNVFISFDVSCNNLILCAGTEKVAEDAFLTFWDVRGCMDSSSSSKKPMGVYSESHSDDIVKICFHPTQPNLFISGSTDGLVNVFDINKNTEDDALLSTCNSGSTVSFIGWSGKDYQQVYCMTDDEGFYWWDLNRMKTEEPITLLHISDAKGVISMENTKLDYLIGGLYHEMLEKFIVVGGTTTGSIFLMDCSSEGLTVVGELHGGHSDTVRCFYWNMADSSLLTGGEDAQLLLWKLGSVEKACEKMVALKAASSVHQRVRVHQNSLIGKKKGSM